MSPETIWIVAFVLGTTIGPAQHTGGTTVEPSRWLALKEAGFAVPQGSRAGDLLIQMNALLASTDPVLRDEVAYSAAERWVVRDRLLAPNELRAVRDLWLANLQDGIGGRGDDRAFKRSFSALCLSLVAAADLQSPFLADAEYHRFVQAMVEYLDKERDLRGFDATRGWIHAVAHTADALKFLARNPKLDTREAGSILAALARKLRSIDAVFAWGEADRIAQALVPIARRHPDLFTEWLQPWVADTRHLWANGPQVDPKEFARVENVQQTLRSVYAALQIAAARNPESQAGSAAGIKAVLEALAQMR